VVVRFLFFVYARVVVASDFNRICKGVNPFFGLACFVLVSAHMNHDKRKQ
jgi:hypothetical protein